MVAEDIKILLILQYTHAQAQCHILIVEPTAHVHTSGLLFGLLGKAFASKSVACKKLGTGGSIFRKREQDLLYCKLNLGGTIKVWVPPC